MSNIKSIEVSDIGDPKLRMLAKRVEMKIRLAGEKAVAHHVNPNEYRLSSDPSSFEQIMSSRFKTLRPEKQAAAKAKVTSFLGATQARKGVYGDLSEINLKSDVAVGVQAKQKGLPADLKLGSNYLRDVVSDRLLVERGGFVPHQSVNRLELRIHKVKCVDETGGWPEWGNDEIALGGVAIDETGETQKISAFTVRNDFDDGEQQVYSPPRSFKSFNILEGDKWPKSYFVTLVLAELDMGGVSNFLQTLLDKVRSQVISELSEAIGVEIGTTSGSLVGLIIAAAVSYVVRKIFGWIVDWWSDDIFQPVTASTTLGSLESRWNGAMDSPEMVATFTGHDGKYQVTYDWRLFAA